MTFSGGPKQAVIRSEPRHRKMQIISMKTTMVLLGVCWLTLSQLTHAVCSEPQPRLVCAEYSASDSVVIATLLKVEDVLEKNDAKFILGRYYTFRTTQVYRGAPTRIIRVYEGNDSGRASFLWKVRTSYLLFLFTSTTTTNNKALVLDGCGNSGPVGQAGSAIREIGKQSQETKSALIAGRVSDQFLDAPLKGVEVVARGSGMAYRTSTNGKGDFSIHVVPGQYSLVPQHPQFSFKTFEMSYGNPENLRMQAGACAQVQFIGILAR